MFNDLLDEASDGKVSNFTIIFKKLFSGTHFLVKFNFFSTLFCAEQVVLLEGNQNMFFNAQTWLVKTGNKSMYRRPSTPIT